MSDDGRPETTHAAAAADGVEALRGSLLGTVFGPEILATTMPAGSGTGSSIATPP